MVEPINQNQFEIVAIGLPSTGKTTFLAALWNEICSGQKSRTFRVGRLEGDITYLNQITQAWQRCDKLPRTNQATVRNITINLIRNSDEYHCRISIPDIMGEVFENQFFDRKWTEEYDEIVNRLGGILLFLHPRRTYEPKLIDDIRLREKQLGVAREQTTKEKAEIVPWDITMCSTQVQIVDLLQFIVGRKENISKPVKLSVIVSAWDLVLTRETEQSVLHPKGWIAKHLPLLDQYLETNPHTLESSYWGISAQGGELDQKSKLLEFDEASERVLVVDSNQRSTDICLPVNELLRAL